MPLILNPLYNNYHLRLNEYPGYSQILQDLKNQDRFPLFLTIRHEGKLKENPHFHIVLQTLQKTATLRTFLKSKFTLGTGNGHMSLKCWDGKDQLIQYMFHEHDCELITQVGVSTEYLQEQEQLAKDYTKGKSKYTDSLYDLILIGINDEDTLRTFTNPDYPMPAWSKRNICYAIWDVCRVNNKAYPNKFLLESIIRKVQAELSHRKKEYLPDWDRTREIWYGEMFD